MNKYLKNLNKIEFVVSYACTGKCKHCAEGDHKLAGERIDPKIAADAVRKVAAEYNVETVMAFGGEPLLYTDAVYAIMTAAKDAGVPCLQIISNGYFSKNPEKTRAAAPAALMNFPSHYLDVLIFFSSSNTTSFRTLM